MNAVLRELRVLDLSRVLAGPLCTQMLADHGADVIKVEPPAGDELRTYGPPFGDGTSGYFDGANRGKRHICLDLRTPAGQDVLVRLLARSDVVVENFRAGTMARWGLGYEEVLAERFPRLIYCRISGFGVDGPLGGAPGYDYMLQAYAGLMSVNGHSGDEPTRLGVPAVDVLSATLAFAGVLLAVYERVSSGRGQLIDATLLDAAISLLHPSASNWLNYRTRPRRTGNAHPQAAPYQPFDTRNGQIFLAANNNKQFSALVDELALPELVDDPRFSSNASRVEHRRVLVELIAAAVAGADRDDLVARLIRRGVPAAPVNDVPEALAQPHVLHRGMVERIGDYAAIGIPIKLSRTPGRAHTPPSRRGTDTIAVLRELGMAGEEIDMLLKESVAFVPDDGTTTRPSRVDRRRT